MRENEFFVTNIDWPEAKLSFSLSLQLTGIELMDTIDIRVNSSSPNDVDVVGRDFFDLVIWDLTWLRRDKWCVKEIFCDFLREVLFWTWCGKRLSADFRVVLINVNDGVESFFPSTRWRLRWSPPIVSRTWRNIERDRTDSTLEFSFAIVSI